MLCRVRGVFVTVGFDCGAADPVDSHLGQSLRQFRELRLLTLSSLGQVAGVSPQQIHKYERAVDRIPASRLFRIGCCLDVPVQAFFDGLEGCVAPADYPLDGDQLRLLAWLSALTAEQKKAVFRLVQSLAGMGRPGGG